MRMWGRSSTLGLILLTTVTWVACIVAGQGFLSSSNLFSLSQLAAGMTVVGLAQAAVIVTGRMNLAVGPVGVSSAMFTGWLLNVDGVPIPIAVVVGLLVATAAGALMACIEFATGLNSFVVTIASGSIYTGVMLILCQGKSVNTLPAEIVALGGARLVTPALSMLVVPALVVLVVLAILYRYTTAGWRMLTVGANEEAAYFSGIRTRRSVLFAFSISGFLCGVAGILEMSRVAAALPSAGSDWMMSSFIVAVLGGTALAGGRVSIAGAALAAVFIETMTRGLITLGVSTFWLQCVQALVLLGAVLLDFLRRRGRVERKWVTKAPSAVMEEANA